MHVIVLHQLRAKTVVITDYPAERVLENIESLVEYNRITFPVQTSDVGSFECRSFVRPHVWGEDVAPLLTLSLADRKKFDVVILAELLW